jgi:hypothetical protein
MVRGKDGTLTKFRVRSFKFGARIYISEHPACQSLVRRTGELITPNHND